MTPLHPHGSAPLASACPGECVAAQAGAPRSGAGQSSPVHAVARPDAATHGTRVWAPKLRVLVACEYSGRVRQALHYDKDTGIFSWRMTLGSRALMGSKAGHRDTKGYMRVWLDGRQHKLHRLAFVWMLGGFPPAQVDHINGVKSDNRWSNLRIATNGENQQNVGIRKDSSTGVKGVSAIPGGKFRASIRANGKLHHLGVFGSLQDAGAAYLRAKKEMHPFALRELNE